MLLFTLCEELYMCFDEVYNTFLYFLIPILDSSHRSMYSGDDRNSLRAFHMYSICRLFREIQLYSPPIDWPIHLKTM